MNNNKNANLGELFDKFKEQLKKAESLGDAALEKDEILEKTSRNRSMRILRERIRINEEERKRFLQ